MAFAGIVRCFVCGQIVESNAGSMRLEFYDPYASTSVFICRLGVCAFVFTRDIARLEATYRRLRESGYSRPPFPAPDLDGEPPRE